jgi:hypothetical protein
MRVLIAFCLLFVVNAAAHAGTSFDFSPASNYSCGTYCTGYWSSDTAYTVDYVNLQYSGTQGYKMVVSVNGKAFAGYSPDTTTGGVLYNQTFDSVTQKMTSDGTFITLTNVVSSYRHTCVRSGRGQHCTTWNWIVSGTIAP